MLRRDLAGTGGNRGTEKSWVASVVAWGWGNDWGLSQLIETMTGGHSPVERRRFQKCHLREAANRRGYIMFLNIFS